MLIFSPTIEDGGVEKNLYNISNFLSERLDKIYLLTANSDKKKRFNKKIKVLSPKTHKWIHSSRLIKTLICIFLFLKNFNKKKNYLILSFNSNIFAVIIARLFDIKIIIRSNTSPESYINNIIKKSFFKFVLSLSNEIIVNSSEFKKQIKFYFSLNSRCILNPLENVKYIHKLSKEKIRFNFFKKNTLNIISVGRLVKQKNHILILKAIKELPKNINCKLLIIGNGEEKNNLKNYIIQNKMKNVKLLPFKKNPFPYFIKSDTFVLSSKHEGLPNVLLEAMALKKFIISSNCPTGPKEILINGKLGELYENNNYYDLKSKIINFANSSKKYKTKVKLAYKSLNRFNYNLRCNDYYKLILKYIIDEK